MTNNTFPKSLVSLLALVTLMPLANAQPEPPSFPLGTIPLPQNPPATGLQSPLPEPASLTDKKLDITKRSPRLEEVAGGQYKSPFTLNQAVAVALATNRSLALSIENLRKAQARTAEQRTNLNPTLNATATYTRLDQGTSVQFGETNVTIANPDQVLFGLQLLLPIDINGLLRSSVSQAQYLEIAARLDINRTTNQLVLDVKTAFYDVLRAKNLVQVSKEALENAQIRLKDAQARYQAGVVAKFDVIRAQTDVLNAQQNLIQARSQVSLATAVLNSTIGIDINTPLETTDAGSVETLETISLKPQDANTTTPPLDSLNLGKVYEDVVKEALATRPEILEADAMLEAAKKGITLARRSQLPSLGLNVSGSYNPAAAGFAPRSTNGQAVLQLTIPLYDAGASKARLQAARADVASADLNRRQFLDLVTLEVRQAYLVLIQTRDRVIVTEQALVQAQEAFRLARVRYNAGVTAQTGVSPLLEVSDAQTALTLAQTNRVNSLYDYNQARARLDKAAGRYSYLRKSVGFPNPPKIKSSGQPR